MYVYVCSIKYLIVVHPDDGLNPYGKVRCNAEYK